MQTDPDSRKGPRDNKLPPPPAVRGGLMRAFGPMIAGLAIDGLDLMTYGPIGLYTGLILGGAEQKR